MSEAKIKAVQAEAKQEAKTVAKTQETMVYAYRQFWEWQHTISSSTTDCRTD